MKKFENRKIRLERIQNEKKKQNFAKKKRKT